MIDRCFLSLKGDYDNNEDYLGVVDKGNRHCFILADGLGGYSKGEVASKAAVEYVKNFFNSCRFITKPIIEECIIGAHNKLKALQKADRELRNIKTTIVLLVIEDDIAYWAHMGDSRLYRFNRFRLLDQTTDHSVPQMMVMMGEITKDEIRGNPERSKLLKALGTDGEVSKPEVHYPGVKLKKGDGFLLCSDGFWEWIDEKQMKKAYIFSDSSKEWMEKMRQTVEKNGSNSRMDNYSAITIKIK